MPNYYPSIIYWPRMLNRDRMWRWALGGRTVSPGRAFSGLEPLVRFDGGGRWAAMLGDVQLSSEDQVRAWRAIEGRLDSGVTPIAMEARDERFAPFPLTGGVRDVGPYAALHSDDAYFSDLSAYEFDVIDAELWMAADLRATSLQIALRNAQDLRGGEYFSIQHDTFSHRLYRVVRVTESDTYARSSAAFTVTIASPAVITSALAPVADQAIYFSTLGALPTGLLPKTLYYARDIGTDGAGKFRVAATPGGAAINTSGSQSGTHTGYLGGLTTITIRPPLREATLAGTRIEWDFPKCIMKLATPDAMDLDLQRRSHGQATVRLVEDFPPFDLVEE
jgi:hypothetical protein